MSRQADKHPYPAFIIGGAAKSGTTSLSRYLSQQPRVFIPGQEPNFFTYVNQKPEYRVKNQPFIRSIEAYLQFMKPPESRQRGALIGEKSVSYLYRGYYKQVIENIRRFHPFGQNIKWVFILRQPVERAYSQYIHNRNFHENLPFPDAIEHWPARKDKGWIPAYDYLGAGYYSEALQAYLDNFEQVRVYLFEDLTQRPGWLLGDLLEFLGVDESARNISWKKHNPSGIPRNKVFEIGRQFLSKYEPLKLVMDKMLSPEIRQWLKQYTFQKPPLPSHLKKELAAIYKLEIEKLEELTGRDLSGWHNAE